MAGDADIREQRPGRLVDGPDGMKASRVFRVFARSEIDALTKLQVYRRVFRGAAWYTTYNEAPNASVVCRERVCDPVVPAPIGGVGDYEITASYETPKRDEAVAGGPPIYRSEDSLQSGPIDVDAEGDPIVNRANEPIGSSDADTTEILRVEWWREFADLAACYALIRPFRNSLNLVTWQGLERGRARMRALKDASEVALENSILVKLQASIGIRDAIDPADYAAKIIDKDGTEITTAIEGWAQLKSHVGLRERGDVDAAGVRQYPRITTQDGADYLSEPVPLGADGLRLPDDEPGYLIMHNVVPKYRGFAELGI